MAASSSSTAQGNVFIGFSGRDTRFSFVSHLSAAFHRKGVRAFVDPGPDSDQFSEETRREMEGSSVCVVVFSKSIASSPTCLDKLVSVLERRRSYDGRPVVVPLFYGVSRAEVEEQKGRIFGQAFSEHETSDLACRVPQWRKALAETARLPGHESSSERRDSELVEEIVGDVREKLDPEGRTGTYSRLLEMESLLCKQSNSDRSIIGLWGMGGIGKTTIAQAAFEQMSNTFEAHWFVQDFDSKFHQKGGLHSLREEMFKTILQERELDMTVFTTKPSLFRDKTRQKRILVILDDVRNPMDAESFLGPFDWFGPGSMLIVTSRDKQVLVLCQVSRIFEVRGLNEREALQLFSWCAFGKDVIEERLLELSKRLIDHANGNPKALSFYGRELKREKPENMETAYAELKKRFLPEILDVFKSSYDALSDNEKNIFLDIACFFRGEPVDYVIQLLEGCAFFPHVGIDLLVEKSLVTISDYRVEMHNLIQDVGREIVNQETNEIERRSRLWDPWSIKYLLEDDELKGTEVIEGMFLDATNLNIAVKPMAFEKMYNLRLLKVHSSDPRSHPGLELRKGFQSLPHQLRLLHWENYPLQSLPQDFNTGHLVELNMPYSQLRRLWEGTKTLAKLKTIRLCHSKQLVEIDGLLKAPYLDLIDLQGCTTLQRFPATGHLEHLRVLNLSGCTGIKSFPDVPPNIRELNLEGTSIVDIRPESVDKLSKLVKLEMGNCRELLRFSIRIYKLKSLQLLNLSGCRQLKSFPEISKRIKSLQYLYLSETAIEKIPSPIQNLTGLRVLGLKNCIHLADQLDSLKKFENLKVEI